MKYLGVDGDNLKLDVKGTGWEVVNWIDLAQDRGKWHAVVNRVMNFWFP